MQKKNHFFSIVWLDKYVDKRSISCLLSSNHFVIRPDIDVRSAQVSLLIRKEVPRLADQWIHIYTDRMADLGVLKSSPGGHEFLQDFSTTLQQMMGDLDFSTCRVRAEESGCDENTFCTPDTVDQCISFLNQVTVYFIDLFILLLCSHWLLGHYNNYQWLSSLIALLKVLGIVIRYY